LPASTRPRVKPRRIGSPGRARVKRRSRHRSSRGARKGNRSLGTSTKARPRSAHKIDCCRNSPC